MIYDLKRSVVLRGLFDAVLHSSLDDLVLLNPKYHLLSSLYSEFGELTEFLLPTY